MYDVTMTSCERAHENWEIANLCVKYRQKIDFYVKIRKNMRFSWDFLQNMLENGHSNLQTNLWVHIASNIFKISNSKITGLPQPPWPPNFESLPYPRCRW